MEFKLLPINSISREQWSQLWDTSYPFLQFEYLNALENSGCTQSQSGWRPMHAVIMQGSQLLAAMPLYLKSHSYGEYVFDWSWANAYEQAGLNYYPKLLNAIPFTPSTGPRIASKSSDATEFLFNHLIELCSKNQYSGFHLLFPNHATLEACSSTHFFSRLGCQFHWFNNQYTSFDEFLNTMSSRKRKNILKERKKMHAQDIECEVAFGDQLQTQDWKHFHKLYATTYIKRSGHAGYLNEDFFVNIGENMKNHVAIIKAYHNNQWLAGALYFYDNTTLYGRYWGTLQEMDALHYECCYYQGIELAIQKKLSRFDAGAQGEHKIQRGFTPILTQSMHHITHPQFRRAIEDHVKMENEQTKLYCDEARSLLPFKEGIELTPASIYL